MGDVQTVLGPVSPDKLGATLAHEHVFSVTPEIQRDFPALSWQGTREDAIRYAAEKLAEVARRGIGTIIDCTTIDHGRDLPALIEVNRQVPINIVAATGLYTHDKLPFFYKFRPERTAGGVPRKDVILEMFLQDITEGIQGTGAKAGIIKVTTDAEGATPNIERILRSAARAHRETGVPITTHTNAAYETGLAQLEIFRSEGVDPQRVVIGHSGDSSDFDYLRRILDTGAFIGADRFGYYRPGQPGIDAKVKTVVELCREGYADQILLAHDSVVYADWWELFPPTWEDLPAEWVPTHISDTIIPAFQANGLTNEQIDTMMVKNPARLLGNNDAY
ncbi:phosphotriesterase family protein [Arthrobacter sp. P2b]|uniref:phosphotriesterase family protein n=1 Tax=Arthrobacter sp. P2b TaxID=1938741 RepID=UPI0009A8A4EC|nr:phosphotriesterase [Arthrobacter sp. P2b]SLK10569.1 phosphotriesterase-related protein [Arthrobacter sp. P2b]